MESHECNPTHTGHRAALRQRPARFQAMGEAPFIVLQAPLGDSLKWLAFRDPVAALVAEEVSDVLPLLRELDSASEAQLQAESTRHGMSSLAQAAIDRAVNGLTTISEVVRITGEEEEEE